MFGFAAAGIPGIHDEIRNAGADIAEAKDGDGERDGLLGLLMGGDEDKDVFPLGKDLYKSGSDDICSVLKSLPSHAKSGCKPCNQIGSFGEQFPFKVPYPKVGF